MAESYDVEEICGKKPWAIRIKERRAFDECKRNILVMRAKDKELQDEKKDFWLTDRVKSGIVMLAIGVTITIFAILVIRTKK